ncbi:E1 ubiquitin-activating protein [Cryptotrichosporon argae]
MTHGQASPRSPAARRSLLGKATPEPSPLSKRRPARSSLPVSTASSPTKTPSPVTPRGVVSKPERALQLSEVTDGASDKRDAAEKQWVGEPEEMSWELRTQTAGGDEHDGTSIAALRTEHARELSHYKTLLVRAQSASSASLNEMHVKLVDAERRYAALKAEHARCARAEVRHEDVSRMMRATGKEGRMRVLEMVVQACHPSDISAQIVLLEKYRRTSYDILGQLDDDSALNVLSFLDINDVLGLRLVCRRYDEVSRLPRLWKMLCQQLEFRDYDGRSALPDAEPEAGWAALYRGLCRREANWTTGTAQTVTLLSGHTNYVTSLKLRADVLISGSYDETIRIWHIPRLAAPPPPLVIPAKAVACLDYLPSEGVFVVGCHDVGRVLVWRKKDQWEVAHTLSGHLHGIRAVAINENWLVSAGADKAIVVWDWRTGQKIVRFGQQTNICLGVQLLGDRIVAVTVDGVVRTFSISSREMLGSFSIAELDRDGGRRLRDVGGGVGGSGMLGWFEGQGKSLTWEEGLDTRPAIASSGPPAADSKLLFKRLSAHVTPTKALPAPTRRASAVTPGTSRSSSALSPSTSRLAASPLRPSPTKPRQAPATPSLVGTAKPMRLASTPTKSSASSDSAKRAPASSTYARLALDRPPGLVEIVDSKDVERGAVDAQRGRMVTSTRFAARAGAERKLFVGAPDGHSHGATRVVAVHGAWAARATELGLQMPGKNPMSLVLDRERFIYGCTDGTIVLVGFVGQQY